MLQVKTKEQQEHITEIVKNYLPKGITSPSGYADNEEVIIWVPYDDGYGEECVDISFEMMAEIVDYLREQNNKQQDYEFNILHTTDNLVCLCVSSRRRRRKWK